MHPSSARLKQLAMCAGIALFASCTPTSKQPPATGTPNRAEVREPQLITSAEGAYWRTAVVTPGGDGATVMVNTLEKFQAWHGLGGTFNERGWHALLHLSEADRAQVMTLLFDDEQGIGFNWGRIPIGASDYALDRYTSSPVEEDLELAAFTIERDQRLLIPFIKAAQQIRGDIKFWASPWTPPPWMKSNGQYDGGAFDPRYSDVYSQYFVKWIQAYKAQGIPIDHVQPQNEPGWAQAYPSCAWGPSTADGETTQRPVTLGAFVENYLAPAIESAGLKTDIWYGTLSNSGTFEEYWNSLSPTGRAKIVGVGLQWGTLEHVGPLSATQGKNGEKLLVMQTEHMCGNYPWISARATGREDANRHNFLPNTAPNNHAYAEESWDLIKQWLEAGVHIYSAWNMVLDSAGFNMDTVRPWPQNALIAVDLESKTFEVTPAYYVFRHVGQFLEPGATRIAVSGSNALAFQNPDSSVVVVMFNPEQNPIQTQLSIDGKVSSFQVPARGWATFYL